LESVGSKTNHQAQAEKLRARAVECRKLAKITADTATSASYLELADDYEALAQEEEDLAAALR
jgi:hypothetical protein